MPGANGAASSTDAWSPPLGLAIQRQGDEFFLVSAPEVGAAIERHLGNPRPQPLSKAATEVLSREPEVIGVAYWMDMALSNAMGIPTVAFGPSGEGAHADVEWVDLASLETCVSVYLRAAELICGQKQGRTT